MATALSSFFDMRFPGQRYDAVSGMNYNYFRDYDAVTGRYVESDR
jgi:RHS repeat-associated protein